MLMLAAGLDLRKPGMRQGQARRTCRSRFELDGDQRFNIAVVGIDKLTKKSRIS